VDATVLKAEMQTSCPTMKVIGYYVLQFEYTASRVKKNPDIGIMKPKF